MTKRVQIAGVEFDPLTYDQAVGRIEMAMQTQGQYYGVTPNPEMLLNAHKDSDFRRILNGAMLSAADGVGVLWASYFLKKTKGKKRFKKTLWLPLSLLMVFFAPRRIRSVLPQRVTGSDLLFKIVERAEDEHWKIFLLGAASGVAEKAAKNLLKKYPKAHFAGSYAGSPKKEDWPEIKKRIQKVEPDILFIAYGSPAQEQWLNEHLTQLTSVRFAMGIGGAFDFAAGKIRRAPKLLQYFGLEWLWRLIRQPSRWTRIVNATYRFTKVIFNQQN